MKNMRFVLGFLTLASCTGDVALDCRNAQSAVIAAQAMILLAPGPLTEASLVAAQTNQALTCISN